MAEFKYPPLLKHSPYVGSASNRVIHKTDTDCPEAKQIDPNERWYLTYVPQDGNYSLCGKCFPESVEQPEFIEESDSEATSLLADEKVAAKPAKPVKSKKKVAKKTVKKAAPKKKSVSSVKKSAAKKSTPKSTTKSAKSSVKKKK